MRSVSRASSSGLHLRRPAWRRPARIWLGRRDHDLRRPRERLAIGGGTRAGARADRRRGPGTPPHRGASVRIRSRTMRSATSRALSPRGRIDPPTWAWSRRSAASRPRAAPHAWAGFATGPTTFRSPAQVQRAIVTSRRGSRARRKFDARASRGLPRDGPAGATALRTFCATAGFATSSARERTRPCCASTWARPSEIDIRPACDIRHRRGRGRSDVTFENVQAGLRTVCSAWPTTWAASCWARATCRAGAGRWCTYGVGDQMSRTTRSSGRAEHSCST